MYLQEEELSAKVSSTDSIFRQRIYPEEGYTQILNSISLDNVNINSQVFPSSYVHP